MNELITAWLLEQGVSDKHLETSAIAAGLLIIASVSVLSYYIAKNQILKVATTS